MDLSEISRFGKPAQQQIMDQLLAQREAEPKKAAKKHGKYGAIKTEANGIRFDSKKEAGRYQELMLLLKAGKIRDLRLQQEFVLQTAYTTPDGQRVRSIKYVADFTYEMDMGYPLPIWQPVVEDVKSEATRKNRVYVMKKKMMQDRFGIKIREV